MFLKNKAFFFTSNHNVIITKKFSTLSNIQLIYKFSLLSHNLFIVYFFKLKFKDHRLQQLLSPFEFMYFPLQLFFFFFFNLNLFILIQLFFIVFSPSVLTEEAEFLLVVFFILWLLLMVSLWCQLASFSVSSYMSWQ